MNLWQWVRAEGNRENSEIHSKQTQSLIQRKICRYVYVHELVHLCVSLFCQLRWTTQMTYQKYATHEHTSHSDVCVFNTVLQ